MPDERYKIALCRALKVHEIGDKSPYQLFFARKGNSGASFGFMQGDLAAGQEIVQQTFRACLIRHGVPESTRRDLTRRLSVPIAENPLNDAETRQVEAALQAHAGLIDAMDLAIVEDVFEGLDRCLAAAASVGRTISPHAQLYLAMWINMSGPPSKILDWLAGSDAGLAHPVDPPGPEVDVQAIERYLKATKYFRENARNFAHMQASAAAGAAQLPQQEPA